MTLAKYHELMNGTITATVRLRPAASREACGSGRYARSRAAASTRARVETATFGNRRRAGLTVATDTPAADATSSMVERSTPGQRGPAGLPGDMRKPYRRHRTACVGGPGGGRGALPHLGADRAPDV